MSALAGYEDALISDFTALASRYGYAQYRMNRFEAYDLYVRNKDFLISDSVITFTDTDGKLMALKPDVTLSIIKNGKDAPDVVQKVYYKENVYRASGGERGFREIMQLGLECIGAIDDYTLYEVLMLAAESLRRVSPEYVLDVSQLNIVAGIVDELGVSAEGRRGVLKCIGEKNAHGIREICAREAVDAARAQTLIELALGEAAPADKLRALRDQPAAARFEAELAQLERILALLEKSGHAGRVRLDFSVINDMNYYNGIAFSGFVPGIPSRVLSGGQYDRLMRKMNRRAGAIGFALYLDLLERLGPARDEYDVDILLLYDAGVPPERLRDAVEMLAAGGSSVMAQKAPPEKIRCRQLLRLGEGGVEILESHA